MNEGLGFRVCKDGKAVYGLGLGFRVCNDGKAATGPSRTSTRACGEKSNSLYTYKYKLLTVFSALSGAVRKSIRLPYAARSCGPRQRMRRCPGSSGPIRVRPAVGIGDAR